ncbi:MAG: serine hydrolase [Anaerolineales bacterium]|nr:serine hydrolase [Anaerolineales bacterium]
MRRRNTSFLLQGVSLFFASAALVLVIVQLVSYSRQRNNYPAGMTIAGVPVGGLNPQISSERVFEVYSTPVEIRYAGAVIHVEPSLVGFELDMESMLAAADQSRTGGPFWGGFWDYLWNRDPPASDIPLRATISEERLLVYLQNDIASRYDKPPTPAQPVPGGTTFEVGEPGQTLDIERAVILIEDALRSPTNRVVNLSYQRTATARPSFENLEILLKQIITVDEFDGVIGVFVRDLQTGQSIHFAMDQGEFISINPDVVFTASSTIKIPIMVAYFINLGKGDLDEQASRQILNMIQISENPPADILMEKIDPGRGPLIVTEYMQTLGLENTFMAGFFCDPFNPCAPLARFDTPANQRTDVFTDPDPFSQTTVSDIGTLLEDIYQCAENGGGALIAAFPEQIDQNSCNQMISFLSQDKIGVLIEAGVPEGTSIAHKHGWITEASTGVIQNISDAAIVYSPGGNYILTIYTYHPVQTVWDPVSNMFARLSQAVYNYFNLQ